jgi:trk system potassium uptake protein TrkH
MLGMLASPLRPNPALQPPKRLRPRLADTALWVLSTYAFATVASLLLLLVALRQAGLAWGDAVLHGWGLAFAGVSTGGFAMEGSSTYGNPSVQAALLVVMVLGATGLHVLVALRKGVLLKAGADPEWRFFLASLAVGAVLLAAMLAASRIGLVDALGGGTFAAVSVATSSGFHTSSWDNWPVGAHLVLLALMFLGGCAASPSGGLKAWRVLLMVRLVAREVRRLVHPRAILPVRVGKQVIRDEAITGTVAFLVTYLLAWLLGALALTLTQPGLDAIEAAGGSAAALGNVGVAFGAFGPGASLGDLSGAAQGVVAALMWLGRLEILAALLLFVPASWKN